MTIRLLAKVFVFEIRRRLDQHEQARLSEKAVTIGIEPRLSQDVGHGLQSRVIVRVLRGWRIGLFPDRVLRARVIR
jgi:hypothetical protein